MKKREGVMELGWRWTWDEFVVAFLLLFLFFLKRERIPILPPASRDWWVLIGEFIEGEKRPYR